MNEVTKSKQKIDIGGRNSGISVSYLKSRRILYISGYYDSMIGIEGAEMSLGEFLKALGISLKDCEKELEKPL